MFLGMHEGYVSWPTALGPPGGRPYVHLSHSGL